MKPSARCRQARSCSTCAPLESSTSSTCRRDQHTAAGNSRRRENPEPAQGVHHCLPHRPPGCGGCVHPGAEGLFGGNVRSCRFRQKISVLCRVWQAKSEYCSLAVSWQQLSPGSAMHLSSLLLPWNVALCIPCVSKAGQN